MGRIAELITLEVTLLLFLLGLFGASEIAIPIGSALLWMLIVASGRADRFLDSDMGWLNAAALAFVLGSLCRCLMLSMVDFELGRMVGWWLAIGRV